MPYRAGAGGAGCTSLSRAGCPVVIHLDRRVDSRRHAKLTADLADLGNVRFSGRHACEWGTWGIVRPSQEAATVMLREFPASVMSIWLPGRACLSPGGGVGGLYGPAPRRRISSKASPPKTWPGRWAALISNASRCASRSAGASSGPVDLYGQLQRMVGFRRRIPMA